MSFFDNHFLFSETYIKEYIEQQKRKDIAAQDIVLNNYRTVKDWHDECTNSNWFKDFIRPVIDTMGFKYPPLIDNTILLYTNSPTSGDKPVAVLFVVSKNYDLDSKNKGRYYAYNAVKAAKDSNVEWAMLTNGYKWRIYNAKNVSPYENYLEIDIEDSICNMKEPGEAFTLFNLFFSVKTYYKEEDGELVVDKIKGKSDEKAEQIEDFLRGKAEEILKDLCYGLKENMGYEKYDSVICRKIYEDAITLLFRMLFFGYAESRGLLPCSEDDIEYKNNSFFKLCEEAKDILNQGRANEIKNGFDFWDRLDEHLRIYVDKTYNGGLFDNDDKTILREYKIANGWLIKCLAEIAYKKDKKANNYNDKIEYKDLSVRNLGSIYEGLLEFNLFIAEEQMIKRSLKGKVQYQKTNELTLKKSDEPNIIEPGDIYLSQGATERKDTGAYYTPEDVVEYIVSNTIGKKIEELKSELKVSLKNDFDELVYEPTESGKKRIQKRIDEAILKFVEDKIICLSIIDSAMGSGHFLVNAAYKLANEIVDILCDNRWENDEDITVDIGYWKRKVVENCIYGIDINSLAVTLAKLSLWLISASNDKALSFIDHHLKEGNSIVGTDRHHVKVKNEKYPIFEVSYEDYMRPIINKYEQLKKIGSATKEDVEGQKDIYSEILKILELVKKKYDYYLASLYESGIQDDMTLFSILKSQDMRNFQGEGMKPLWKIASEKKFFHWELEFPEVFLKGGFDIAIGNPPYVDIGQEEYKYSIFKTINTRNLYSYMMEVSINNCLTKGMFGFIVPLSSMYTPRMKELQDFLVKDNELYISNYAIRPAKIFKNVEQRITIFLGVKSNCFNTKIHTTGYIRWYSNERKRLFDSIVYELNNYKEYGLDTVPKIGWRIEKNILSKIYFRKKRIKDYITDSKSTNLICYHGAARYWLKAFNYIPEFYSERKGHCQSSEYKTILLNKDISSNIIMCLVNSSLFYWYWILMSDERHFLRKDIENFPFDANDFNEQCISRLSSLADELMSSLKEHSIEKTVNLGSRVGSVRYNEFHPKYSKWIIDEIDKIICKAYGFTDEEIYFITNYDVRFRMGDSEGE